MTKAEALKEFRSYGISYLGANGRIDQRARRKSWCDYTDSLHKDKRITDSQVKRWTNPFPIK